MTGLVKIIGNPRIKYAPTVKFSIKEMLKSNIIAHQATIIRRDTLNLLGFFNLNLKIKGDYDLWLRSINAGYTFCNVEIVVATYLHGGRSSNYKYAKLAMLEKNYVLYTNNFVNVQLYILMKIYIFFKYLIRDFSIKIFGYEIFSKFRNFIFK